MNEELEEENWRIWQDLNERVYDESPEVWYQWELDQEAMISDPAYANKVRTDMDGLVSGIRRLEHLVHGMKEAYGGIFEQYLREKAYPHALYYFLDMSDPRYPYSPSRAAALRIILDYLMKLIEKWHEWPLPGTERKTKVPTVGDELHKIHRMNTVERLAYLEDYPEFTEIWLMNQLERRRKEEQEYTDQQKQEAIKRFGKIAQLDAEKLSGTRESEANLRETLKKWVQKKQTK